MTGKKRPLNQVLILSVQKKEATRREIISKSLIKAHNLLPMYLKQFQNGELKGRGGERKGPEKVGERQGLGWEALTAWRPCPHVGGRGWH